MSSPPPIAPTTPSRIRGALYGLAVSDALGGPVEFQHRGSFPPVTGLRYNGNFSLPAGSWTDDTSMTLCLAESLVAKGGKMDIRYQTSRYVKWMDEGYLSSKEGECFDVGNATRIALGVWRGLGDNDEEGVRERQRRIDQKLDRERSCGNGSLMRCIPIPLMFYGDLEQALVNAAEASRPTHPHQTCVEACQVYTRMVVAIMDSGNGKTQLSMDDLFDVFRQHQLRTPAMKAAFSKFETLNTLRKTPDAEISSSGFVVHTLMAAIWAFFTTESFGDGALKVVNLGDDADTVGAVYGGLAGSYYGYEAIPGDWISGLQARHKLDPVVEGVVRLVCDKDA